MLRLSRQMTLNLLKTFCPDQFTLIIFLLFCIFFQSFLVNIHHTLKLFAFRFTCPSSWCVVLFIHTCPLSFNLLIIMLLGYHLTFILFQKTIHLFFCVVFIENSISFYLFLLLNLFLTLYKVFFAGFRYYRRSHHSDSVSIVKRITFEITIT